MATEAEIFDQVDLLADGYGRSFREDSRHYEAYCVALGDVEFGYLKRGVVRLLREKLQFMPTPAEVRAHALAVKDTDRQRDSYIDDRRLVCAECQDTGILRVVNRRWVAENRDQFTEAWFVAGWMLEAFHWCRNEHREDLLVCVICGCDCRRSQIWNRQRQLWANAQRDNTIKANPPAFMNVYDDRYDCVIVPSGEKDKEFADDVRDSLLSFVGERPRAWSGNWTP